MPTRRHRESKAGQRRHPPTVVTCAARDGVCGALERLSASDSRSASKNQHYRNSKAELYRDLIFSSSKGLTLAQTPTQRVTVPTVRTDSTGFNSPTYVFSSLGRHCALRLKAFSITSAGRGPANGPPA